MTKLNEDIWLNPKDLLTEETKIKFLDEGRYVEVEETGFEDRAFEIKVQLPDMRTRSWTMNKTSRRAVIRKFGDDTKLWINKEVILVKKSQNVKGKDKEVIYVKGEE